MSNITKKLLKLTSSEKTVFTTGDLRLFWNIENKDVLKTTIFRAVEKGYLVNIRRGLYRLNEVKINEFELAGKLKKNSYISFETVLAQVGVIFQWYDEIFSASDRGALIKNKYGKFRYRKLPKRILADRTGIVNKGNYFIATPERAFCDKIYKDGLSYFDDTTELDREELKKISKIYNNKRVVKDVKKVIKDNRHDSK
ncbi:MAG TPA: hypothetical protein ENJ27_01735 [Candidatus Moranbacteria bacterium]|nr:hypothetical protein [Candidatus Moranbacteria bacterium]